jgi:hypothetical protein
MGRLETRICDGGNPLAQNSLNTCDSLSWKFNQTPLFPLRPWGFTSRCLSPSFFCAHAQPHCWFELLGSTSPPDHHGAHNLFDPCSIHLDVAISYGGNELRAAHHC